MNEPGHKVQDAYRLDDRTSVELSEGPRIRLRLTIRGTIQGVGFRPLTDRLARELGLVGWVANSADGACLEIEGSRDSVQKFLERVPGALPGCAAIGSMVAEPLPPGDDQAFVVRPSLEGSDRRLSVPPDLATCEACCRELADPADRRFGYPFVACTRCGPRYSILAGVPYDRARTTMQRFPLCDTCRAEYLEPSDRRYHAESMACPACGPSVTLRDGSGALVARAAAALRQGCDVVRNGGILAVKGLGGFQLWVDARSEAAVQRLRGRKHRPHKPFAVLFPSLAQVRAACRLSGEAAALLASVQSPIVILPRLADAPIATAVAPDNPTIGGMLPFTPLHHVLMGALGFPVVATSGNRSEEPLAIDEEEALARLHDVADLFLVHDRAIARPVDDSVVRLSDRGGVVIRRARGYAPLPLFVKEGVARDGPLPPILAVGGHLKNAVAFGWHDQIVLSQHVGDLLTPEAVQAFQKAVADLGRLLDRQPRGIACDLHPDYHASMFAETLGRQTGVPVIRVQHHHAHVAACLAEHDLTGPVLGLAWDGAGYGPDGTLWGGEFLAASYGGYARRGSLRPFGLPGGEQAARDPRRPALSLLSQLEGASPLALARSLWPDWKATPVLLEMLAKRVRSPVTSSMGRLFDAVAALTGLCTRTTFEGQAAMAVEHAAEREAAARGGDRSATVPRYELPLVRGREDLGPWHADWRPLVRMIASDLAQGISADRIALDFHAALADLAVRMARTVGLHRVVLTGGCFQNMLLTRLVRVRLEAAGFGVYAHTLVPPNDGGLAVGQVMVAAHAMSASSGHQVVKSSGQEAG